MRDSSARDWNFIVRERLVNLRLEAWQQEEIIAELAGHLEEVYEGLCAKGICKADALQRSLEEIDWRELSRKIQSARSEGVFMNDRTRQFWLPAFVSLAISEGVLLALSFIIPMYSRLWQIGPVVLYGPWLLSLPAAGAAGAYLSRLAGGGRRALLGAVWFPAIVGLGFICGGLLITLVMGVRVFARPQWFYVSLALIVGVILPCVALWLGSLPFLKEREART